MNDSVCPDPLPPESGRVDYTPLLEPFLKASGNLMSLIVSVSDDKTIETIVKAIQEKDASAEMITDLIKNNILIVALFSLGIVLAFLMALTCIGLLISRCCCPRKRPPRNSRICCAETMFILCGVMSVICIALVASGAQSISFGINELPHQVNKSAANVGNFVDQLEVQVKCLSKKEANNLTDYIDNHVEEIQQDMTDLRNGQTDYETAQNKLNGTELKDKLLKLIQIGKAVPLPIQKLIVLVEGAQNPPKQIFDKDKLKKGIDEFNKGIGKYGDQCDELKEKFSSTIDETTSKVFASISDFVKELTDRALEYLQEDKFTTYSKAVFIGAIIIPSLLLLLCVIPVIMLIFRMMGNSCKDYEDTRNGLISRLGGQILGVMGYVAMLITVLLFILSSIAFLAAVASVMIWVGFFEDKDLRVFRATDNLLIPNNSLNVRVSDIFYNCNNGHTFLDAMNGSELIPRDSIKEKVKLLDVTEARKQMETVADFTVVSPYALFLNSSQQLFEDGTSNPEVVVAIKAEAEASLTAFQNAVEHIADTEAEMLYIVKKYTSEEFDKKVNATNDYMMGAVDSLMKSLAESSSGCTGIMTIWNDIGWYLSNMFAIPLSGIWIACFVTACVSILIFNAIFDATKYLKSYRTRRDSRRR